MFWRSVARWVILAIAVPVTAIGIRKLSERIEAKQGSTRAAGLLRKSADGLDFVSGRSSQRPLSHK
jgi:hypothetical protein